MAGFFVEAKDPKTDIWTKICEPQKTRDRAKRFAKKHLDQWSSWDQKAADTAKFRLCIDDPRHTIEQVAFPPHKKRMRWVDATWDMC